MWAALTSGLLMGLAAGFSPGPLSVLVLANTLRHGVAEGSKVALAPLVTDPPIVAACLWLVSGVERFGAALGAVSLAGAGFVLHLAWDSATARPLDPEGAREAPHALRQGILANFLSPHPYLFWVTVGAPLCLWHARESWVGGGEFLGSFYLGLVGAKLSLAWATGRARSWLTGRPYVYVMRGLGLALAVLAFLLAREGLRLLGWF
ncbi:MAG: LysE family transporter [Deltaproteobacteria bacterium]|nr:LysE family transporter [Deltaproteobacteria bacterium]